jgi:hypothetical protein
MIYPPELSYHLFIRFGTITKQLLPALQYLLRLYEKTNPEIPPRKDAVEALVDASKFGGMSNEG